MPRVDSEKNREYARRYREQHPEKARESQRRYRERNPEKAREWERRYREQHRERLAERQRERQRKLDPKQKREQQRRYREQYSEKIRERAARYRRRHPERLRRLRWRKHGINYDQAVCLLAGQGWTCAVQGEPLTLATAEVDHDHGCCNGAWSCGRCIRGLVCESCNKRVALVEAGKLPAISAYLARGPVTFYSRAEHADQGDDR